MPTSKQVTNFVINKVPTKAIFNKMKEQGLINDDEIYLVKEDGSDGSYVSYESQTLTDAQKQQARTNIGAISFYSVEIIEDKGGNPVSNKTFQEIKQAYLQGYLVIPQYEPNGLSSGYGYVSAYYENRIDFTIFIEEMNSNLAVTMASSGSISVNKVSMLPNVTTSDNNKFLRVVGGNWKKVSLTDVSKEGA